MRLMSRLFLVFLSALVLAIAASCSGGGAGDPVGVQDSVYPSGIGNNSFIVGFVNRPGRSDETLIKGLGGKVNLSYKIIPAFAVNLPPTAVEALSHNPRVAYVEPDFVAQATADMVPWGIARVNADDVWALGNTGMNVKVAILDTGIDYAHPDLSANYKGGRDFVNGDMDPMDDHGHGTHVAGTVGAASNITDVVGAGPNVSLYGLKVLNSSGSGSYSWIIAGLDWCVTNGIQIASMSLGGTSDSSALRTACDNAVSNGVLIVAAAGNSGNSEGSGDNVTYPARYDSVIAVAATDSANVRAYFSSTGPALDLAAPGVYIQSDKLGGGIISASGTSMACPHVTGVAALVIASGVTGPANIRARLIATSSDLGAAGFDNLYGNGLVDALRAVSNMDPPPPPPPPPTAYGNLSGKAFNASTGKVLKNVTVLVDTGQYIKTDRFGNYIINNIVTGDHMVQASLRGYVTLNLPASIRDGTTTNLNFYLTPK